MLRARCFPAFLALAVCAAVFSGAVHASAAEHSGALGEVPLPGGLSAALTAIGDRVVPDRSQFLLEFIRRTYATPPGPKTEPREAVLRALLVHLEKAARPAIGLPGATAETVPLPLTPAIWTDAVFAGRATPETLVAEIIRARGPALLYYGLLSLDDETRAWLAAQPGLIREIATANASGFAVAAPGLRVANGAFRVPGGELAVPGWESLVGRKVSEPVEFIRAVIADRERRFGYFLGVMGQLTAPQAAYAMNLTAGDAGARSDAIRRLHAVFEHIAPGWQIDERTFWRPAVDPALLLADLPVDAAGRPGIPGTRRFWTAAFVDGEGRSARTEDGRALAEGPPADFVWLCEQIFGSDQRRRYPAVLFAARVIGSITADSALAALDAARALGRFPALVATLERANIRDVALYGAAAARAARLSAIDDDEKALRALTQYQGALALLTRAARRGGVPPDAVPNLLSSLAAADLSGRGEYEGAIVRWLDTFLQASGARTDDGHDPSIERALVAVLAGAAPSTEQLVEWEGTRYRVDPTHAERARIARLLGDGSYPYLTSARALVGAAEMLEGIDAARDANVRVRETLERVAQPFEGDERATFLRLGREVERRGARGAPALRAFADTLASRGLLEFTYAVALGHPDRTTITAADAARRHDFGLHLGVIRRLAPWRFPAPGSGVGLEWHVVGSLLGLDVKLAEFSLVAVSLRPPQRRPAIPDEERRVFVEAVALAEPAALTDADRDAIVDAIQRGRARVAAMRSIADAAALADEIRLSAPRRTLFIWTAAHHPDGVPGFFSHSELLAIGAAGSDLLARLDAWGAPAEPRLGCLCVELVPPGRAYSADGRWNAGVLASGFPDLNLRLAELLAELQMPAALLPGVLAPATLDFVNTAECRDPDDRRGLADFVRRLRPDRVEQYLALLTSDGPLVPAAPGSSEVTR